MKKIMVALMALTVAMPVQARTIADVVKKPIMQDMISPLPMDELAGCLMSNWTWGTPIVVDAPGVKRMGADAAGGWISFVLTLTPNEGGGTRLTRQGQTVAKFTIAKCVPDQKV